MREFFSFQTGPQPQIIIGDCLTQLRLLPDASIDCCVTSPPYFNLRDYQTSTWQGGDPDCSHRAEANRCRDCGAEREDLQIGLEPSPSAYVAKLVEVFDEVRRVLKPQATLWLNLGDSYANDTKWGGASGGKHARTLHGQTGIGRNRVQTGLKAKDLIGIPWECAFALRESGWYLRSDIIWHKNNVMPESVRDRVTKAHEYVFMFSKSPSYYFDSQAVAEPTTCARVRGPALHGDLLSTNGNSGLSRRPMAATRNRRSVWTINTRPFRDAHFATMPEQLAELCILAGTSAHGCCGRCGAPWRRSSADGDAVWVSGCDCPENSPTPCCVLDPFGGAGTTGVVAQRLNRRSILIELNPDYAVIAQRRLDDDRQ